MDALDMDIIQIFFVGYTKISEMASGITDLIVLANGFNQNELEQAIKLMKMIKNGEFKLPPD
jgi:hypothetical protein